MESVLLEFQELLRQILVRCDSAKLILSMCRWPYGYFHTFFFLCESSEDIAVWSCQENVCQVHFSKGWNIMKHEWIVSGYLKRYSRYDAITLYQINIFSLKYGESLKWTKICHISLTFA